MIIISLVNQVTKMHESRHAVCGASCLGKDSSVLEIQGETNGVFPYRMCSQNYMLEACFYIFYQSYVLSMPCSCQLVTKKQQLGAPKESSSRSVLDMVALKPAALGGN